MIVKHTKPFVTYIGNIFFFPGNNTISEEGAKILLNDPEFKKKVESGSLEIVGMTEWSHSQLPQKEKINLPSSNIGLSVVNLPASKAIKIVSETYSIPELEKMMQEDLRKGVQKAIENQIAKIKEQPEPEKPKEE